MRDALSGMLGIARSLNTFYVRGRDRRRAMDALHARFIRNGNLAFDIGAHVGDRVASFRRLGARAVAVEPQPALARTLALVFAFDRKVTIEPVAVGSRAGEIELKLNVANPLVATASDAFVRSAHDAPGWEGQAWTRTVRVPVTTLDALIVRHGAPHFVKIDVEGFEDEVLAGLSRALPALSLEFTTIQRGVALRAVERLARLGAYRFNAILGERHRFVHEAPMNAGGIVQWIERLPGEANSGDVFASLDPEPLHSKGKAEAAAAA